MEELTLISNPSSSRKSSLLSSSTTDDISIPVSKEKKQSIIKKNPIKKLTFNKKLEESEEIKKLKQKHLKHYTTKEIIQRSIKFSLKNWRYNIYTQVQRIIDETCSMILPVYHANIINAITQEKNYNLLKSTTTKYLLLLFFKFLFGELMQVFAYFFIRDSLYEYKNIVLENRKKLEMTGIKEVGDFNEEKITAFSTLGTIIIKGIGLHIEKFNNKTKELNITGNIVELKYSENSKNKNKSFLSRLFK